MKKRIARWLLNHFRDQIVEFLWDEEFAMKHEVLEEANTVREEVEYRILRIEEVL